MREYGDELRLCAHLEATAGGIVSRQIGTGATDPGGRVMDVVSVTPGQSFADRARITDRTIPRLALVADVGVDEPRPVADVLPAHPRDRVNAVVDRAVDTGFFERVRRSGRTCVRRTVPYPDDWFEHVRGFEVKPDLGRPGRLADQLRTDASLGLLDEVVLVTRSHVTGAHLHRIPEPIGVWRIADSAATAADGLAPLADHLTVVRESRSLPVEAFGIEPLERLSDRREIATVTPETKRERRRVVAERAYGKGWRTFDVPACTQSRAWTVDGASLPGCAWAGRIVEPSRECGPECPGFAPGDAPAIDARSERAAATDWVPDPAGPPRQVDLGTFDRS